MQCHPVRPVLQHVLSQRLIGKRVGTVPPKVRPK